MPHMIDQGRMGMSMRRIRHHDVEWGLCVAEVARKTHLLGERELARTVDLPLGVLGDPTGRSNTCRPPEV